MVADNNLVRAAQARGSAIPVIDASLRDSLRVILPRRERRQTRCVSSSGPPFATAVRSRSDHEPSSLP